MKTDKLKINRWFMLSVFLFIALVPEIGRASLTLSIDGDARYSWDESDGRQANLNLVGASVRKSFSDKFGDRIILFGLLEAEDNFSDLMLHEIYGQYKGPLGAWNLTVGRFGLPWGLLPGFSASRLLYKMPHDELLGMDVDSGAKVSGVLGAFDYSVSITQGYGPGDMPHDRGPGLGVARFGLTPGDTEELTMGLSAAWGRSIMSHDGIDNEGMDADKDRALRRALVGVDATLYLGRWLGRMEIGTGKVDYRSMSTIFTAMDYALLPDLDLNMALNAKRQGSEYFDDWFVGVTYKPLWFTIRGGYTYARESDSRHKITLQLYRLFNFSF